MNVSPSRSVTAIVCAAGKGERAGFAKNKLLERINGKTVLERTLSAFDFSAVTEILVTASQADFAEISALCGRFPRTRAVLGGNTRFQSVFNALRQASGELVLVHDGARPFVKTETILGCIASVLQYGSGVCAVPAVDTIALTDGAGKIAEVPPRKDAFALQTPQGFYTAELLSAYEKAAAEKSGGYTDESDGCHTDKNGGTYTGESSGDHAPKNGGYTDDSSVFAAFVGRPRICAGARDNIKLTYAEDFKDNFARVGFGVDTHAFGRATDFVMLGGVKVPSDSGLIAHSDGDVLAHAVMDAMLSAAGLKDIGYYFPDKDEKWQNADSMKMLAAVKELIAAEGFAVKNLSVAVQAERPRLAAYIDAIRQSLAAALEIGPPAVGVSAGTNEGLGYVGEGKGITVSAYVLLKGV